MIVWRQPGAPFICIQPIPLSCTLRNSAFGLQVRVISRHTYIHTERKTLYDITVFKEYLDAFHEKRETEDITPVELQKLKITVSDLKSKSVIFSVFTSNISSQNFA